MSGELTTGYLVFRTGQVPGVLACPAGRVQRAAGRHGVRELLDKRLLQVDQRIY